ncbi:MAG: PAS domain-containing protein [Sedimentisphaerales bacterium]|nr:PAS domain-containing protein [Sedimentisphaerales bacterium]
METRQLQDELTDSANIERGAGLKSIANAPRVLPHGDNERMEQALIRALQEWEATFNATRDPIMLVDKEFKIVQANYAASRFLGKPFGQILGKSVHGLLYETTIPSENCPLKMAGQTNRHEDAEIYIPQTDTWVAASADPVKDDDHDTSYFVYIIRDITYRKKAEQTLAQLNSDLHKTVEKLQKSNQELRSFAHVIAHDLKSPLRGIGSLASRLIRKYNDKLDDEGADQLRLLIVRVKRMGDFIDGILRYSEIGHYVEEQQAVDINALLAEIIGETTVSEHLEIVVSKDLPTVRCERLRLKQVFQNLISNAVKYIDKPKGKISVACVEENGFWKFSVSDNGCGIKEQYYGKIFEIFQTLVPRDKTESTGIGLTIVKKIVETYGGKVWVTSVPGTGSTFFFTLPKKGR